MIKFDTPMAIRSNLPQINALRREVETASGIVPKVHADFESLTHLIERKFKEHISETTLERLWGYSTRSIETVSRRTLDVLSRMAGHSDWDGFCEALRAAQGKESDIFEAYTVKASELQAGDRVRIGWMPDRICELIFLGDNRFEVAASHNATLKPGTTFTCNVFRLGKPLEVDDLQSTSDPSVNGRSYAAGTLHGLTTLEVVNA